MSDNRPLYNSRIIDTYLKLIKRDYSYVNISELLDYAKMKPYEVADQGHWFTQEQVNLFHERLEKLTGNKDISREAGRYAASPDAVGIMRQYILGLVGPSNVFSLVSKVANNFTKSSHYTSKTIRSNQVEIIVEPCQDGQFSEKSFQCENRMGFFEAVAMVFYNKLPRIEHPECLFKGGEACRYVISWEISLAYSSERFRNLAAGGLLTVGLAFYLVRPGILLYYALASIAVILLLSLATEIAKNRELKSSLSNLKDSIDHLIEQTNVNYNNALMTNEVGQVLSKQTNTDDILSNIIQILQKRLDYDRGLILLANPDKSKLAFRTGFGYSYEQMNLLKKTSFHLDRPESKGVFVVCFRDKKPLLINDIDKIESSLTLRSLAYAKKLGSQSFICCPIICEEESIGILAVDNLKSKKPLIQSDMSLLMGIAPMIGISIRNAELIDAKNKQFTSILQVLAASIDARDSLTAGHSEKVTEYALGICEELELPQAHKEAIRVAALLHDYGKIGVPDSILKKMGKLTPEEYEIVKEHSKKTKEILEQINFEGVFACVPEIAGAHHENIDGSGYPNGLKAKDIPLGAKIIAVADFFEAITSKRHYRDPMPLEQAFLLLEEESNIKFEKKIVKAMISYYEKTYSTQCDRLSFRS